jgi:cell division protein FtsI (penicillin-binding protein 3)/stage V sporulation protein D (sporulation-specific penicillin-binding protein)
MYAFIKNKLSDDEVAAIDGAQIDGIYVEKKKMRHYPQGTVGAQLAGFVDEDGNGQYGLEDYYNDELSAGKSIFLNIDYNIQYRAEEMLSEAKERLNAVSGEAIVADPATGAILAMAKTPNFNPNEYKTFAKDGVDIFKNDSCQTLFEPGSVFKAVTMASALNEKKITPETEYVDTGMVKIGGWPIYNYGNRSYGRQTMTNVLEYSINTGVVFAQSRLGNQLFADYIEKFGIFEPTGIDLPETFSSNAEFKKGYEINYATAAYGQGIWMTSIQLIRAYSAIANGGLLLRPSIAKTERKNNDETPRRVIDQETSKTVSMMLASVVDNGFGKSAKIDGYSIAGKTGTAQMSWSTLNVDRRGYSDKTTQSFIGFFPSENPKFLILVKLVSPEANTAEYSSLPVFKELAQYVIYVSQLPPEEKANETAAAPTKN